MSLILSWVFGWVLGLGLPTLISAGCVWLLFTSPYPLLRRAALAALVACGCWAAATWAVQSIVAEAIRHERAAVDKATADERARNAAAKQKSEAEGLASAVALTQRIADLERQLKENEDEAESHPAPAGYGLPADSVRRLRRIR